MFGRLFTTTAAASTTTITTTTTAAADVGTEAATTNSPIPAFATITTLLIKVYGSLRSF